MSDEIFTAETFVGNISKSKAWSLLEIVSISTGGPFSTQVPIRGFAHHSRFVYASEFQKKHNDQFSKFPSLDELAVQVNSVNTKFDFAFVDPWHEIQDSFQIIEIAVKQLHAGATLIMHDCHPRDAILRSISAPEVLPHAWCGSTWVAWSLLTQSLSDDFSWMTIDADYGLGVLKVPTTKSQRRQLLRIVRSLSKQRASGTLPDLEWSTDAEHLHLVEPNDPQVAAWA
jgi:hypothetical protein